MSGRSAIVRKKNDRKSAQPRNSVSAVRIVPNNTVRSESVTAVDDYHHGGPPGMHPGYYDYGAPKHYYPQSPGEYGPPPPRQPAVLASAIEKSGLRTQVDGMSDNFRGKLGRMFGGGKSSKGKAASSPPGTWDDASSESTPQVNDVPSLIHSHSTDQNSRSMPPNFPFHSSRSKPPSSRHAATYSQHDSSLSLPSAGQPEFALFGGHRENRGRKAWRNVSQSPENLSTSVDTVVRLFAPSQTTRALAVFHVNSQVLRDAGCAKWVGMLADHSTLDAPDTATISSTMSNPDYNTTAGASSENAPRIPRPIIKFELHLDCPDDGLDIDPMSWVMTTRNFFAILHDHDSLCGRTLYEALSNLLTRLTENADYLPASTNKKSFVVDYLVRHRFLDVRNTAAYAISLLAFSQLPAIQWKEAAIETFVHCAGMRMYSTFSSHDAQHLSPYTNILISNNSNEMKQRLARVQKYFGAFDFSEMWPATITSKTAGRAAFERFRTWLTHYIMRVDPTIHDAMATEEIWMSHERIQRYKRIFHSLFDYLVNRDVELDAAEYEAGGRCSIVSKSGVYFKPDPTAELPMTEIVSEFDNAKGFPHLPAPYPLVPPSQPPVAKAKPGSRRPSQPREDDSFALRGASYTEASNFQILGHDAGMDPIISEFVTFEQNDEIRSVDPRDARLGRWVLIYGALQMLATIETITPGVRYKDGVRYCMSCKVSGVLPWVKEREGEMQEALSPHHSMAYPFTVPPTWPAFLPKPRAGAFKTMQIAEYGDGRKRPDVSSSPPSRNGEPSSGRTSSLSRSASGLKKNGIPGLRGAGRGGLADPPTAEDMAAKEKAKAEKARGRREKAFGFSDYKPEPGW